MEFIFDCHTYLEERNIKLVVVEFTDYVISWWDKFILSGRRNHKRPIDTWDEMKAIMRGKNRVNLNNPNSIANKQLHTIKPKLRKKLI